MIREDFENNFLPKLNEFREKYQTLTEEEQKSQKNELIKMLGEAQHFYARMTRGASDHAPASEQHWQDLWNSTDAELKALGAEFWFIDNMKEYLSDKSRIGKPETYAKSARIKAVQGSIGDKVITKTKSGNGLVETENVVTSDPKTNAPGWIVTNIGGGGSSILYLTRHLRKDMKLTLKILNFTNQKVVL